MPEAVVTLDVVLNRQPEAPSSCVRLFETSPLKQLMKSDLREMETFITLYSFSMICPAVSVIFHLVIG